MDLKKWILKLFAPEVSKEEEKFERNHYWSIVSKYTRKVLKGEREFKISFDDYDIINKTLKFYSTYMFSEKRLDAKGNYKLNPLGGIKDIRIGINPREQEALLWIKTKK
jgi:hypothetical protein